MTVLGTVVMVLGVLFLLNRSQDPRQEQDYILPKMVIAGMCAIFSAGLFDLLAKIDTTRSIRPAGICFYGGLLGAIAVLSLLIKKSKKSTQYTSKGWFDLLTIPFVCFHICGRIGCFLGGCCYGKVTTSPLGIAFPDIPAQGIYHYGRSCYPTQLFEVCLLLIILLILSYCRRNRFALYLCLYAIGRFVIEFFRGDSRGAYALNLSPAQWISIGILATIIFLFIVKRYRHRIVNFIQKGLSR